ncbi:MAG: hypothetical protein H9W80_05170 [Enterococcus sp.]|nr:hypothetical protein [Enterococcus sp.]
MISEVKNVVSSYRYDYNHYYNQKMNYHNYKYRTVPDRAKYSRTNYYTVGGAWNHTRYEVVSIWVW